jgi:hypothetical protein
MHVEQFGNSLFISNPRGWDMTEGTLHLSLVEAKALRDAIDPQLTKWQTEGAVDNGEDG